MGFNRHTVSAALVAGSVVLALYDKNAAAAALFVGAIVLEFLGAGLVMRARRIGVN
ncbi:hypothetical protein [Bradyrhizobium pachyrhizi]|uniref:hypothetical protein n=1 Tax=Bradyrhizobium pachyrhizi TaxID=280333 RepID=UPI000ABCAAF9|nr:hypothetical protein [Bradyrhizobium pachyrhizi]